jgi:hypothetical protein
MKLTRSAGQTGHGSADWFTGTVFIDTVRNPDVQSAIGSAHVRFAPGARTAWHSHPKGQTLYVTDGIGPQRGHGDRARIVGIVLVQLPGIEQPHPRSQLRRHVHDRSPAPSSWSVRNRPSPPAPSTAQVRCGHAHAQRSNVSS